MIRNDSMFNLYDNAYIDKYIRGASAGRKLNVWDVMRNYFNQFKQIGTSIFSYDGLTDILTKEIEKRLFLYGVVGFVDHNGQLTAVTVSPYGEDVYNRPTNFTFSFGGGVPDNSRTPEQRQIGVDGVLGYNTFDAVPTAMLVEQYALMLAHTDISIINELVNGRFIDVLKAHNEREAESAAAFTNDLYSGKISYIKDYTEEIEVDRATRNVSHLREYIDTKDYLLKNIYSMFGLRMIPEKRERMIKSEVETGEEMLMLNIFEQLKMRKKMCDDIKAVFGVDVGVRCKIDIDASGTIDGDEEFNND